VRSQSRSHGRSTREILADGLETQGAVRPAPRGADGQQPVPPRDSVLEQRLGGPALQQQQLNAGPHPSGAQPALGALDLTPQLLAEPGLLLDFGQPGPSDAQSRSRSPWQGGGPGP
jgi:hypothetical protein